MADEPQQESPDDVVGGGVECRPNGDVFDRVFLRDGRVIETKRGQE
ncbi:hypothetical protein [Ferrovibrio terrae]